MLPRSMFSTALTLLLAVGAAAATSTVHASYAGGSSVGKCSPSKGAAAYKRCLAYMSMGGTAEQRENASRERRRLREQKRECRYSPIHREVVCVD